MLCAKQFAEDATTMDDQQSKPDWLDLETNVQLESKDKTKRTVVSITGVSRDTLDRHFSHLINKPSPGRCTMKMRHVLGIANGSIKGK